MIQRSKQRYSNMLWNMRSITRHKRSYGHPLHPDLTPDVLTCVLPLGTVSSGRESEVESAHLFLTIIQFLSACHLTSQHTSTCIHNSIISHSPTRKKTKVIPLKIGAWNVRTLMDSAGSDRPQRRTALVGREIGRYGIEIAALSETCFAEIGEIKEVGAGYIFFWSGRKTEERREAGVGFAIKSDLVGKLTGLPNGINDRLMTLRLPLSGNKHATIVSAYAPTMTNPDEVKDKFYDDLDNIISATPRTDKLILLGDFNARVGTDHQTWEGVIGSEGVGKCNSNGLLLLRKCAEHDLLITNTVFKLPNRNKTSWMHPRSKHWHLIDYVIVRRIDRQDVRVTKTMCGADCWTDHRLVVSKLNLRIQPARRPQGKKAPKRLDV